MSANWQSVVKTLTDKAEYNGDGSLNSVKEFVEAKAMDLTDGPGGPAINLDVLYKSHLAAEAEKAKRATLSVDDTPIPGTPDRKQMASMAARMDALAAAGPQKYASAKAMYNIKAQTGRTSFANADEMTEFNAAVRIRLYELYGTTNPEMFRGYKSGGFFAEDQEIITQKDASDALVTSGGALLANYLKSEILWATEEWGVCRWLARNEIMYGNNTSFARKTALPSFRALSSGAAQSTDITYDLITLIPKQGAALIITPLVLFEQTATALGDTIAESLMEAYWNTVDDCYFNGTGTLAYFGQAGLAIGLTGTPATTTSGSYITASASAVTSWTQADFLSAMSAVKNVNTSRCKWVMSRQVYVAGPLRLATALTGKAAEGILTPQNTYMVPAQQRGEAPNGPKAYLYGEPVYFSQRMSVLTGADVNVVKAYYGDFETGSIIGHRTSIEIAQSMDYAFNKRALATRAFAEWAINICGDGRASSTTCGPIAALQTSS